MTVSDLRPVEAEDLLGRDPVPPTPTLLARNHRRQVRAGDGRRRLDRLGAGAADPAPGPRRLVLLDASEGPALRDRARGARAAAGRAAGLGAGRRRAARDRRRAGLDPDRALVRRTIESNAVETIYHAAAYKHVPIVEHNRRRRACATTPSAPPCWRMRRRAVGVERFVLVSTDKAVRPTNVMGASKRLAEMVAAGARRRGAGTHRVHDGALRQCARQFGLGGAAVPPPDRGRRSGDASRTPA